MDGGQEFGSEVQEGFDPDNTFVSVTAAESPSQNGLAERHGGLMSVTSEQIRNK